MTNFANVTTRHPMRFIRIFNIAVALLFVALWIVLLVEREKFQGDGLVHPEGYVEKSNFFSENLPYGIMSRGRYFGFISEPRDSSRDIVTGIWELNPAKNKILQHSLPVQNQFDSVISIIEAPDTSFTITGVLNDSLIRIIHLDTTVAVGLSFVAPAPVKAVQYINGKLEMVFGRQKKLVGTIGTIGDSTINYRKYELPGFFDRICEIVAAWSENKKWRFLLRTDFHRRNEKWVLLDSSRRTNFLIFDERAVYPEYPGIAEKNKKEILALFDYTVSGLAPNHSFGDTIIVFDGKKLKEIPVYSGRENKAFWFLHSQTGLKIRVVSWDNNTNDGFLVRYSYLGYPSSVLPFTADSGRIVMNMPNDKYARQIFFSDGEFPIGFFKTSSDSITLISNKLNLAQLDANGRLLDRKTFLTLVNNTISRKLPKTFHFLDTEFPNIKAMMWLLMLYGLIPLWLLSIIVVWLVDAIRVKPKFAVRERNWSFLLRLLPGSILYFLVYAANIVAFLKSFSVWGI